MILEKIRKELKKCGVSRYEVAKKTGIDQTILFRIYHNTRGCTIETADKLCKYLGLELQSKPMKRRPK